MGPVNQTANPQQQSFALEQLQRLFGPQGTPYGVAPTSGPYNWAPQMEVGGARTAMDGSTLGGINLGYVSDIYGQNAGNQAAGDARIREIFGPMFGGAGAGQPAAPPMVNPQASVQMPSAQAAAAPPAGGVVGAQSSLPPSFAQDLMGLSQAPAAQPQASQQAPMPQASAFAPAQGQNQNMGIQQLNQIYQWLLSQGVQV